MVESPYSFPQTIERLDDWKRPCSSGGPVNVDLSNAGRTSGGWSASEAALIGIGLDLPPSHLSSNTRASVTLDGSNVDPAVAEWRPYTYAQPHLPWQEEGEREVLKARRHVW